MLDHLKEEMKKKPMTDGKQKAHGDLIGCLMDVTNHNRVLTMMHKYGVDETGSEAKLGAIVSRYNESDVCTKRLHEAMKIAKALFANVKPEKI